MEVPELLKSFKCFEDKNFSFNQEEHKYTYNGVVYTSVTQFLKKFHKPFDQKYWSNKKADDRGVDTSVVLKEWKDKNDYANLVGSEMHEWIEFYFKGIWKKLPTNTDVIDRINKFNIIYSTHLHKLTPVTFELRIFSKKYPLAGTIDSIFIWKDSLICLDWKSNGDYRHDDHPKGKYQKLLDPLEDYWQNHHNEYSIQVSLYKLILAEWGFNIKASYLVHIGPNEEAKLYKAHDFTDKLSVYLDSYFNI